MKRLNVKRRTIVTTSWDDGHKTDIRLARLLKKYNLRATFYVAPNNKGCKKSLLLNNEEIRHINKNFEIGGHTMTHCNLTRISSDEITKEITSSKDYLEKITNTKVKSFCYPYGDYNKRIFKLLEKAGYSNSRTTKRFHFDMPKEPYQMNTSIHVHNQKTDLLKTLIFLNFNLVEFYKSLDWEYLAKKLFDYVMVNGGVYHLWGHSWEIENSNEWSKLENVFRYISNEKSVVYIENKDLLSS